MSSLTIRSTVVPSDTETHYTHVNLQLGLEAIPWDFLRRLPNLTSLTVVGLMRSDDYGRILPFPGITRLHFDRCHFAAIIHLVANSPNVNVVTIARSADRIKITSESMQTLCLIDCKNVRDMALCADKLKEIWVDGRLPSLCTMHLDACIALGRLPNAFSACNWDRISIWDCSALTSIKTLCDNSPRLLSLDIINCVSLCKVPEMHISRGMVVLRGCPLVTLATLPLSWRLLPLDKCHIKFGGREQSGVSIKAALQERFDANPAESDETWDFRRHRKYSSDVNELFAKLCLGLERHGLLYHGGDSNVNKTGKLHFEEILESFRLRDDPIVVDHPIPHHLMFEPPSDDSSDDENSPHGKFSDSLLPGKRHRIV